MTKTNIARVAHEINKAYCESIGDHSQPSWDDAPEWQKSSAINGVKFHLENPEASASASHDSWLKQKAEEGWKYGPVKDPNKKEHPCFVPYDQLPIEQRSKDYLFRQIVHSLKTHIGEGVNFNELRNDPELYLAYQSNIAIAFQDEYYRQIKISKVLDIHKISNEAAKNFLDLLIP